MFHIVCAKPSNLRPRERTQLPRRRRRRRLYVPTRFLSVGIFKNVDIFVRPFNGRPILGLAILPNVKLPILVSNFIILSTLVNSTIEQ